MKVINLKSAYTTINLSKQFKFVEDANSADYVRVADLLNGFGLDEGNANLQERTFKASSGVEFIYHNSKLVACGRVLSDGISQSAVYNIAVDVEYQGLHLGSLLMKRIIDRYKQTNIVLHTHPDTVEWYKNLGFRKLNTGLIIFNQEDVSWFKSEGFIV